MALLDTRYPDRADMGGGPDVYARWGRIMTEWREELIEKMARYIACASSSEDDPDSEWCNENWPAHEHQARAALAVAEPVIREQEDNALLEENAQMQEKIEVMKAIIKSLASDLEEEIYTRFGENGRKCMPDRYERDMQPVLKAREILGETE
jgi:hypothetical protein